VRGKLQLQTGSVDIHEKLQDTLTMVESDARAKQLKVETRLDASLHRVQADGARMHQVLWNLAKNAIKFTPIGGTIVFRTWNEAGGLTISCTDDGIGIQADALPKIFEPFEQAGDEITKRFGGLGLGLTVSRALVEAHGGTLAVRSDGEGKGATFTIRLPRVIEDKVDEALRPEADFGGGGAGAPLNILLVEDHADTAQVVFEFLTSRGHRVRLVHAVEEALRAAAGDRFEVLISDINLPDGSGLDLVRRIEPKPAIGAIAVSGFGMDEDLSRSRQAGFDQHLT
jgi:CheY-like chemotaxis protein